MKAIYKTIWIDQSPWLTLNSVAKYLGYKSVKSARRFMYNNKEILDIRRIPGGPIRIKQSSIDNVLERI